MRIDIGCGNKRREGYLGLDQFAGPQVDHVLDLTTDPFPFADDSVDAVFSSHFLEHIPAPNHVLSEIGRICKDGARIEIWTPYAFSNEAFAYGHLQFFTEDVWLDFCVRHRDLFLDMLNGRWQLHRVVYSIPKATVDFLASQGIELDFAVRFLKGVVAEMGVEIEFRRDLRVPVVGPERCYVTSRSDERRPLFGLAFGRNPLEVASRRRRAAAKARVLARRLLP